MVRTKNNYKVSPLRVHVTVIKKNPRMKLFRYCSAQHCFLFSVSCLSLFLSFVLSSSRCACGMLCGLPAVCLFLRWDVKLKAKASDEREQDSASYGGRFASFLHLSPSKQILFSFSLFPSYRKKCPAESWKCQNWENQPVDFAPIGLMS